MNMEQPYIIAEIASTHEGEFDYLCRLVREIARTGADAVKFQIYLADEIVEKGHPDYQDFLSYQYTNNQWKDIIHLASELKLDVWVDLSGEYGQKIIQENVDLIKGIKLHASDTQNIFAIEFIKSTDFDLIISCGGTTLVEIFSLLDKVADGRRIILMHGFQSYPTDINDSHIQRIKTLSEIFPYSTAYADHISGDSVIAAWLPLVAIGAGASVIEKHITMSRAEKRDDYYSSLEPDEFKEMVEVLRLSVKAYGEKKYDFTESEINYRQKMKTAVFAEQSLQKGDVVHKEDIRLIMPSSVKPVPTVEKILNQPLSRDIEPGSFLKHSDLENKIVIFVNARLASSRLPGKALLPFYEDLTTIEYLLMRLKHFKGLPGKIVFATTTENEDAALRKCAEKTGVDFYRGANRDVMKRMLQVAEYGSFDTLVRVTGDSPLISGEHIIDLLNFHFDNNLEYSRFNGLPNGIESEVIDLNALAHIHRAVVDKEMTEQLTWYLDSQGTCRNGVLQASKEHRLEQFRLTLDYQEDLDLMKDIVNDLQPVMNGFYIPTENILDWLREKQPQWRDYPSLWPIKRESVNTSFQYVQLPQ